MLDTVLLDESGGVAAPRHAGAADAACWMDAHLQEKMVSLALARLGVWAHAGCAGCLYRASLHAMTLTTPDADLMDTLLQGFSMCSN